MENSPSPAMASRDMLGWIALVISVVAVAGSLWLSIGLALKACPLCLYQRAFAMSALAVLAVGRLTSVAESLSATLLALPAAVAGTAVSVFHVYLETIGRLECPAGLLGIGTAPQQSLSVLALLSAILLFAASTGPTRRASPRLVAATIAMGLLLAAGAVASAPPMPPSPAKAYDQPPDVCRPPFRAP